MSSRPLLLLDVMDTLVLNPFHEAVPAFFALSMAELLEAKDPGAWLAFERGELDELELAAGYFRDRRAVDLPAWRARMRETYAWLPGIEALLEELAAAGIEMHALSNYPVWWRMIEDKLELSRFLRWSFVSCETGVRKPDAAAYLQAAAALGREPGGCVFVDDRRANCDAARAVGMGAIVFEHAAQLREALVGLDIL